MSDQFNSVPEDCTHDCNSCSAACGSAEKRGPSFFDKMNSISETLEAVGEDNIIRMLNEAVSEWEAEEAAEAAEASAEDTGTAKAE